MKNISTGGLGGWGVIAPQCLKQQKCPLGGPSSGQNVVKCPLMCTASGKNVINCSQQCPSSGQNIVTCPLGCPSCAQNMVKCLLGGTLGTSPRFALSSRWWPTPCSWCPTPCSWCPFCPCPENILSPPLYVSNHLCNLKSVTEVTVN